MMGHRRVLNIIHHISLLRFNTLSNYLTIKNVKASLSFLTITSTKINYQANHYLSNVS